MFRELKDIFNSGCLIRINEGHLELMNEERIISKPKTSQRRSLTEELLKLLSNPNIYTCFNTDITVADIFGNGSIRKPCFRCDFRNYRGDIVVCFYNLSNSGRKVSFNKKSKLRFALARLLGVPLNDIYPSKLRSYTPIYKKLLFLITPESISYEGIEAGNDPKVQTIWKGNPKIFSITSEEIHKELKSKLKI